MADDSARGQHVRVSARRSRRSALPRITHSMQYALAEMGPHPKTAEFCAKAAACHSQAL